MISRSALINKQICGNASFGQTKSKSMRILSNRCRRWFWVGYYCVFLDCWGSVSRRIKHAQRFASASLLFDSYRFLTINISLYLNWGWHVWHDCTCEMLSSSLKRIFSAHKTAPSYQVRLGVRAVVQSTVITALPSSWERYWMNT